MNATIRQKISTALRGVAGAASTALIAALSMWAARAGLDIDDSVLASVIVLPVITAGVLAAEGWIDEVLAWPWVVKIVRFGSSLPIWNGQGLSGLVAAGTTVVSGWLASQAVGVGLLGIDNAGIEALLAPVGAAAVLQVEKWLNLVKTFEPVVKLLRLGNSLPAYAHQYDELEAVAAR